MHGLRHCTVSRQLSGSELSGQLEGRCPFCATSFSALREGMLVGEIKVDRMRKIYLEAWRHIISRLGSRNCRDESLIF